MTWNRLGSFLTLQQTSQDRVDVKREDTTLEKPILV